MTQDEIETTTRNYYSVKLDPTPLPQGANLTCSLHRSPDCPQEPAMYALGDKNYCATCHARIMTKRAKLLTAAREAATKVNQELQRGATLEEAISDYQGRATLEELNAILNAD